MSPELLFESQRESAVRSPLAYRADAHQKTHPAGLSGQMDSGLSAAQLLSLQPVVGNRAVQRLLARRATLQRSDLDAGGSAALGMRDANGVAEGAEAVVAKADVKSGSPLPTEVRTAFENSLGADLAGVRVHTGNESAEAAHAVGAKAYTVGQDIHFGAGQYSPYEPEGARLVAHEVAHTVQHQAGAAGRHNQLHVSTPQDATEVEAERAADAMIGGKPFQIGGTGASMKRAVAVVPTPVATIAYLQRKCAACEEEVRRQAVPPGPARGVGTPPKPDQEAQPAAGGTQTPDERIAEANSARLAVLRRALTELNASTPSPATAAAVQRWLHVGPADPTYAATITAVRSLYDRNAAMNVTMLYQANSDHTDPAGNACPTNLAYSRGGVAPIYFCENFMNKGVNCRRDVMVHEYFHLLGLALPPQPENYGAPTTALALTSPDTLTQLAVEISDGPHGAYCKGGS